MKCKMHGRCTTWLSGASYMFPDLLMCLQMLHIVILVAWYITFATNANNVLLDTKAAVVRQ